MSVTFGKVQLTFFNQNWILLSNVASFLLTHLCTSVSNKHNLYMKYMSIDMRHINATMICYSLPTQGIQISNECQKDV